MKIQTPLTGLLDYLGAKTGGQNPDEAEEFVQPTLDVKELIYPIQFHRVHLNAGTLTDTFNFGSTDLKRTMYLLKAQVSAWGSPVAANTDILNITWPSGDEVSSIEVFDHRSAVAGTYNIDPFQLWIKIPIIKNTAPLMTWDGTTINALTFEVTAYMSIQRIM